MALTDFNFVVEPSQLRHLARNIEGNKSRGSVFFREVFPTPESIANFALAQLTDYRGRRIEREVNLSYPVGYEGVISLSDPRMDEFCAEMRRRANGGVIWDVRGIERLPTSQVVIIAGPRKRGTNPRHILYTVHPGMRTPSPSEFGYNYFWRTHAMICG